MTLQCRLGYFYEYLCLELTSTDYKSSEDLIEYKIKKKTCNNAAISRGKFILYEGKS